MKPAAKTEAQAPAERRVDLAAVAERAVQSARRRGAQEAAADAALEREVEVVWRDGKLEKISEATTRRLSLQLFVDGRYAVATTSDLRPEAVETFIESNIALARTLAKDPFRALPEPALYKGQSGADLQLLDAGYEGVTAAQRRELAAALEGAARGVPGAAAILSVTGNASDSFSEAVRVASNGFQGRRRESTFALSTDVSVKDSDGRRPEEGDYAVARHRGDLPAARLVGESAARRALGRLQAKKVQSAVLPMVVENRASGRLLSYLLGSLMGGSLQQKRSFLEGKLGQAIGSSKMTLIDDPHLPRALGSRLFDAEGITAQKRPIFEAGTLRGYFIDTYYGRKLKMAATGGRPSNLTMAHGDKDGAALVKDLKDGVLVTGFIGGNSNGTTGDFGLGVQGFRVRDGQRAEPLSEMNISGNHLELWKHLVAVGNDPFTSSTLRIPALLFDQVQFAGV